MSLKPRSLSSLDYTQLFDEGCVRTYKNRLIQHRISELAQEQTRKEALQARKEFRTYEGFKLPKGKNLKDLFGEQAETEADEIIEQERHIFAESKEAWLLKLLKRARNSLKMWMLLVDEEGNIVKPTFVNRVIDSEDGIRRQIYADVFGEKDPDRITIVNSLKGKVANVSYLIPYSSDEVKALYAEVNKLATPDHFEVWRNNQILQVYGGRYELTDSRLKGEAWLKRVKKRAEKLMAERAKKATA